MKFSTTASVAACALFSTTAAIPREDVWVSDFTVRKTSDQTGTTVKVVDFKITANDVTEQACTLQNPVFPSPTEVTKCGDSKYSFTLHQGTGDNEFALRLYHNFALTGQYWGDGDVPTVCRAGGNGAGDYVCTQNTPVGIFVFSKPPPSEP